MNDRFSVIIPVYNAQETIQRCLDSLINQKCGSVQIILVNDGSKDKSGDICKEYARQYDFITYLEQENAGASVARNAGLAVATGEYITFVDSDDYVADGYFEGLDCNPEDMVTFAYTMIRQNGMLNYQFCQDLVDADDHIDRILGIVKSRIGAPWNKRFKRSIIEENRIRFQKDLVIGEDFIFGLTYMLHCTSSRVDPTVRYCVDETGMESITRAGKYEAEQFLKIYDHGFQIAEGCDWDDPKKKRLQQLLDYQYCRTAFAATEHCFRNGEQALAKVRSLIKKLSAQYDRDIPAMNIVHLVMRWCVKHGVTPAFLAVAGVHKILRKIRLMGK